MTPRRHRVRSSHTIARLSLRLAGAFGILALAWAAVTLIGGGSWWGPLHSFVVGSVLAAISGAAQMFTITWSAAPPPGPGLTGAQRRLLGAGAALVLAGVAAGARFLVWPGVVALTASLGLLAWSLAASIHRSLLRRFDLSARFYLLALAAGAVGVTLGGILATAGLPGASPRLRMVHAHLNLVGLIGLTIVGTLPTFLPTVAHHRAVSGGEAAVAWWVAVAGVAGLISGLWWGPPAIGGGVLLVGTAASLVLGGVIARLWDRGRRRPPFLQVALGSAWLIAWSAVEGTLLVLDRPPVAWSRGTLVVVTAGIGQVLAGSLAYLLPVLAGPPLASNERRMTARSSVPLILANATGVAAAIGSGTVAAIALCLWVLDLGWRVAGLRFRDRTGLEPEPPPPGRRHIDRRPADDRPSRREEEA